MKKGFKMTGEYKNTKYVETNNFIYVGQFEFEK